MSTPLKITGRPVVCRDKNHAQVQSGGMFNVLNKVDLVPSNVQFSHQEALLYVFEERSSAQDYHKGKKPNKWDMFPEPTELLLIGYSIESIRTQKSKSNVLTPKTNSQTC